MKNNGLYKREVGFFELEVVFGQNSFMRNSIPLSSKNTGWPQLNHIVNHHIVNPDFHQSLLPLCEVYCCLLVSDRSKARLELLSLNSRKAVLDNLPCNICHIQPHIYCVKYFFAIINPKATDSLGAIFFHE